MEWLLYLVPTRRQVVTSLILLGLLGVLALVGLGSIVYSVGEWLYRHVSIGVH